MLTTTVKWISLVAATLLAALSWRHPAEAGALLVGFIVWAGILVTLIQALTMRKFGWATGFVALAIMFNPVFPFVLAPLALFGMRLGCVATFAASLMYVHAKPRLTIQSITETAPRSESL